MNKFKVGDRVRLKSERNSLHFQTIGTLGTVESLSFNGFLNIIIDNDDTPGTYAVHISDLEPVNEE